MRVSSHLLLCFIVRVYVGVGVPLAQAQSLIHQSSRGAWPGPSFREFSGVNQSGDAQSRLFDNALSWNRNDISWGNLEPRAGVWQQAELDQWGQRILAFRQRGVSFLPILDYTAQWAADRSARQWEHGNTRWQVQPRDDHKFDVSTFSRQPDGTWKLEQKKVDDGNHLSTWPIAAEHRADWENYVRRVVKYLRQPPYNVEYFQIWNEAYPTSGFWNGDLNTYIQRVHLPAAKIIHELGGKVVYGGWPCIGPIDEFVALLDRNQAWNSLDVLDVHYLPVSVFETLRGAATQRGYATLAIWQTEVAFTSDPGFVGTTYPRALYWALSHGWNRANQYKLFFFPQWAPDDPKAYGYQTGLNAGDHLSPHGQSLLTLANELKGVAVRLYFGVTATPDLKPQADEKANALEAFAVEKHIVVAVHLDAKTYNTSPTITLHWPLMRSQILKAERVDLAGERLNLTDKLTPVGNAVMLEVDTKGLPGTPARAWNDKTSAARTFLVVLTQK